MALYTYECLECYHEMTLSRSMRKSQIIDGCPRCGGKMQRQWRPGGAPIFRGTGFFETDYKRKGGGDEHTD